MSPGWPAAVHVLLASWPSTSSVPRTHEFFSGLQTLQNIFIVPTDPARKGHKRAAGEAEEEEAEEDV